MRLEKFIFEVMKGERRTPFLRGILAGISFLYRAAILLRHAGYDKGILAPKRLSVPVISVGNLVVGGTGKTPCVMKLVQELTQRKKHLAILTRGFDSAIERSGKAVCISKGDGPLFSVDLCGDEPYMMAHALQAAIWVGRDRVVSGRKAIAQGARCLILDDGMQHRRLARDLEIVLIDGADPLAEGRFLPRGLLREHPMRLKAADFIVVNHVRDESHLKEVATQLRHWTDAPLIGVGVAVKAMTAPIKGPVGIFCGIGRPERFVETVRALGHTVVDTLFQLDHRLPSARELHLFAEKCKREGAHTLLCTTKDAVKLSSLSQCALPIVAVPMELEVRAGKEHWDALINKIEELMQRVQT